MSFAAKAGRRWCWRHRGSCLRHPDRHRSRGSRLRGLRRRRRDFVAGQVEPPPCTRPHAQVRSRCRGQRDGRVRMARQSRHARVQGTAVSREIAGAIRSLPEPNLHPWFMCGSAALLQSPKRQIPVTDEANLPRHRARSSGAPRPPLPNPSFRFFRLRSELRVVGAFRQNIDFLRGLQGTFSFPATFSRETSGEMPWPSTL